MIKNIIILKRIKSFYLLILILFLSYSCSNKYDKNDFSEIIKITINRLSIESSFQETQKVSIEFSPRLERNLSDKVYLENNFSTFSFDNLGKNVISERDIDFMLKNKKKLVEEQKNISDYIDCNNNCIYTDSYFEGDKNFFKNVDSFVRITRPYISKNHEFAIIGYGSYNKYDFGKGYFLLNKKKNKWVIVKKINNF